MDYLTPTDKVDHLDLPKIIISKPSSLTLADDDRMALLPKKFKMVCLKEMIRMPKLSQESSTVFDLENSDKKAFSVARLENIISTDNSQSEMKEETGTNSQPKNLSLKKRKCESLAASPAKKDSLKKTKITMNRQKTLNDIQKLLKDEKELERDIFAKKNEDSSEKDQKYEEKIEELDELSSKWKDVSQNALYELHKLMADKYGSEVTLSRIILELGIKASRLDFNAENEDFDT